MTWSANGWILFGAGVTSGAVVTATIFVIVGKERQRAAFQRGMLTGAAAGLVVSSTLGVNSKTRDLVDAFQKALQ